MKEETTPTAGLQLSKETILQIYAELKPVLNKPRVREIVLMAMEEYKSTTPAPLSEQKQEGEIETVKKFIKQSYEHYLPLSECLNMLSDGDLNTHDCLGSLAATMEAYASQHTAKQIEELTTNNFLLGEEISSLNNEILYQKEQIDQYKARIVELEAELITYKTMTKSLVKGR